MEQNSNLYRRIAMDSLNLVKHKIKIAALTMERCLLEWSMKLNMRAILQLITKNFKNNTKLLNN